MRRASIGSDRGSGLIVAMAVLAMLSIMATTFIALVRLDTRISNNYSEDVRCELLATGVLNYFKAVLREDLDRTWNRYENRDTGVGFVSNNYGYREANAPEVRVPGFYELQKGATPIADPAKGIPVSNDFWFCAPWTTWGDYGNLYSSGASYYMVTQQSFAWNDHYGQAHGMIGRYWSPGDKREYDLWVGRANNLYNNGYIVAVGYPGGGAKIDDDADGTANPDYVYGSYTPFWYENNCDLNLYYDKPNLVMFTGNTYYFPGTQFTAEDRMPSGLFWRWGVKLGVSHSAYSNVNVHGNMDGGDSAYLSNMGGLGLEARRAMDETTDKVDKNRNAHLGRIAWKGFPEEYEYKYNNGFPEFYNEVAYHPSVPSLERLFKRGDYDAVRQATLSPDLNLSREKARNMIRYRWGDGTGIPGGGTAYRTGWRRDGATFYKFPSPENPDPRDNYFGANEVMEHDHAVSHPYTSNIIDALVRANRAEGMNFAEAVEQAKDDWRELRPHVTMWSSDTILRGKIWFTEGRPFTNSEGDWRHIDILKRVNINIIGASGPEGLPNEDRALKQKWLEKRDHERKRLYYMLLAALKFSGAPWEPEQKVCQFIASLADTVDRDHELTYYVAPDGSGAWALGNEKFPVINEVVFFSGKDADKTSYEMTRFRVELYNPCENIPWIPDEDETFDISDFIIKINDHAWRLGDDDLIRCYGYGGSVDTDKGAVRMIGADGMYAYPDDPTPDKKSWSRIVQIGWKDGWPAEVTRAEMNKALQVFLYRPLTGEAAAAPYVQYLVEDITDVKGVTRKCMRIDRTFPVRLVPQPTSADGLQSGDGPGVWYYYSTRRPTSTFVGVYRRWDPLNSRLFKGANTPAERDNRSTVLWAPGSDLSWTTLGKPNTGYTSPNMAKNAVGSYKRHFERNLKIVNGDLPSIGWLGEILMVNPASNNVLTDLVATDGQDPTIASSASIMDPKCKFNLCQPFFQRNYKSPDTSKLGEHNPINLHVLDCFTVWDPSNDGIDNDGDGAIDDDDTGRQPGDKGGPEVRVFGRVDWNLISESVMAMVWPDNKHVRGTDTSRDGNLQGYITSFWSMQRQGLRQIDWAHGIGPVETIGDLLRADTITRYPGIWLAGSWWGPGAGTFDPGGLSDFHQWSTPWRGDDDGDGTYDEFDERDMIFTWICNFVTTRANIFECDLSVQTSAPPVYPSYDGESRKLPFPSYKVNSRTVRVTKQLLAILDRSTCLRINPDGTCEFSGPVESRMVRFTDDVRTW